MMRYLFLILALAAPHKAAAVNFDSYSGDAPAFLEAVRENPVLVLERVPLLEILAGRAASCKTLEVEGFEFLASVAFDDNWEVYFQLSLKGSAALPSAWKESLLKNGVVFKYAGGALKIKEENGAIVLTGPGGGSARTSGEELFGLLYANSTRVTFAGLVSYAVIRNTSPLSLNEGTVTLRKDMEGLYYYSLTPDPQITGQPRWLLAINGVLYGLQLKGADLAYVSKALETGKSSFQPVPAEAVFSPGR